MMAHSRLIGLVAVFAIGLVVGLVLRPLLPISGTPSLDKPTDAEATAAVRIATNPSISSDPPFPRASVKVGDCSPSTLTAGIMCAIEFKATPQSPVQVRNFSFARLNGVWKVTGWL